MEGKRVSASHVSNWDEVCEVERRGYGERERTLRLVFDLPSRVYGSC